MKSCPLGRRVLTTLSVVSAALAAGTIHAQQAPVFAYPNAGQSQELQSKDRFECHQWSVSQSGFDPSTAPPMAMRAPLSPPYGYSDQPPPPQTQGGGFLGLGNGGMFKGGGMVGDAATGAALGAAGGALAGNAGQGAAIGALASTMLGAVSRSSTPSQPPPQANTGAYQQQQYQQQMQADQSYQDRMRRTADYNQAFGVCMKARNYTVN